MSHYEGVMLSLLSLYAPVLPTLCGKVSNKSFLHLLIFPSFVSFCICSQPIKVSNSLQNKKPLYQCVSVNLYVTCNPTFTEQSCSTFYSQLGRSTAQSCFCSVEQNVRIFRISVIYILRYQFIQNLIKVKLNQCS